MKGAFETMILFFFGMMFFCLLIYAGINLAVYQQARCYQEMIVACIEHHHGYNEEAGLLLEKFKNICPKCSYSVKESFQEQFKYQLTVEYPVVFPILNYQLNAELITYAILNEK